MKTSEFYILAAIGLAILMLFTDPPKDLGILVLGCTSLILSVLSEIKEKLNR